MCLDVGIIRMISSCLMIEHVRTSATEELIPLNV